MSGSDNSYPNRHNAPVFFNFAADDSQKHIDLMTSVQNAINGSDAAWTAYYSLMHAIATNMRESDITKRRITLTNELTSAGVKDTDAQRATKIIVENAQDNLKDGGHGGPA